MAIQTYSEVADALFNTELKGLKADSIEYIRQTQSIFHLALARWGAFSTESGLRQDTHETVDYGTKEATTRFMPDENTAGNLSDSTNNPSTRQSATFVSAAFNVNYNQEQLKQLQPSYIRSVLKGAMGRFYDEQERLFVIGDAAGTTITRNAPYGKDDDWNSAMPMSLAALMLSGTNGAGLDATSNTTGGDASDQYFMGIDVDTVGETRGQPYRKTTADNTGGDLLDDMDQVAAHTAWGTGEIGTTWLTDFVTYAKGKKLYKAVGALENPMQDNLGLPIDSWQHGITDVLWHRDLAKAALWDWRNDGANEAVNPIFLLNMPGFELCLVSPGNDGAGMEDAQGADWLSPVLPGFQQHTKTSVFKRMSGTYALKYKATRGSLGQIGDMNL